MTAFFGIIHFDGKPAGRPLLEDTLNYLSRIGPDEQEIWMEGPTGFCQANLNLGYPGRGTNVFARSDRYMVIGDVRIDGRKELLAAMSERGRNIQSNASDQEIILEAWLEWGERLTERLIGDFSLAIWDRQTKALFCLRDHMGIRPFYYARMGNTFIFSNVLNCLRRNSLVSEQLNDQAVVDFLVFAFNQEFDTTFFKDIRQLPPAHNMKVSQEHVRITRYWSLPVDDVLRYRKASDYIDRFLELLDTAIQDRLPETNVGIAMSGGLDSTSIAACTSRYLSSNQNLSLYTLDIKSLWPEDEEVIYAKIIAKQLNASSHVYHVTVNDLFEYEEKKDWLPPEPSRDAFRLAYLSLLQKMIKQNRVGFTGHGSDPLLMPSPAHLNILLRKKKWGRFLMDAYCYIRVFHRRPPFNIRAGLKKKYEKSPWRPTIPPWLRDEILNQTDFARRFSDKWAQYFDKTCSAYPERPEAYSDLSSPIWPATLLRFDPHTTGMPIQFHHPYFDIRLLRFVLAMPGMPWFHGKELLRRAMSERLPDAVRTRTKDMPRVSPVLKGMTLTDATYWQKYLTNTKLAANYINIERLQLMVKSVQSLKSDEADLIALPVTFGTWLRLNSV